MTSRLRLLGTPTLLCDGIPVVFPRRKAMALLSYLAVTRSRHHRESLATILWPESGAISSHSALRNLLWMLRTTPIAGYVRSDRSIVELAESNAFIVDVNRFRDLTASCPSKSHGPEAVCAECIPLLEEAASLWTGPFMRGYVVANSVSFDDWQFAEGEALKRELSEGLDRMIEYYLSIEEWAACARCARKWVQVDELNESAYRSLMTALSAQGKRSEALQAYDELTRVLAKNLGLAPEDATAELAESYRVTKRATAPIRRSRQGRLPHPAGRMIGRRELAKRAEDLLLGDPARAVNLVGLGGIGKTCLALHVGRYLEDRFAHGAALVPLDSLPDEVSVASAVQNALGVSLAVGMGGTSDARLADVLRDLELLIIFDGVERLLPQISALIEALKAASAVRILLTSRIEISTANVVSVPVHGLECPAADAPPERLPDYAAVRLLRVAAERHGNALKVDAAELRGMARLARLLEGSPLGLEMAAGWRAILTWDAIADRVSENLEFLVHRDTDVAPKHRTLAAVFEQSWDLLPADGRAALRKLSVFRGDFTIEAAERVAESGPSSLATLTNRCLLMRVGPDRYRMHGLLRRFASAKLAETKLEAGEALARHVAHYTSATAEWSEALKGPGQQLALLCMDSEIENIRLAFQTAAATGASEQIRAACEGLCIYYIMRTLLTEGESVFAAASRAYGKISDRDPGVDAFLRISAGWFASWELPDAAAVRKAEGMALLPETAPTDRLHAMANVIYAYASFDKERDANLERLERSLAFYRGLHARWEEAFTLAAMGAVERYHDEARSEQFALRNMRIRREIGDAWGEGLVQFRLAQLAESRGNLELALTRYREARRLNEPFSRDHFGVISVMLSQARVTGRLGDMEGSMRLAEEALCLSRRTGYQFQIGRSLLELARATRGMGDSSSAKAHLQEAFSVVSHRRWSDLQAACARMLLEIALDESDVGAAERWLQEAVSLDPESEENASLTTRVEQLHAG